MFIEYDGGPFNGWQIQPGHPSVQETIEGALKVALRQTVDVVGSGRTDTGVHARGQVAHFHTAEPVDTFRLFRSLNGLLPPEIAVYKLEETAPDFHARYDARWRRYHYYATVEPRALDRRTRCLLLPAPDFHLMDRAAGDLLGKHPFDSFCRAQSETQNRVCTVRHACWIAEERPGDWRFEIEADRFLHGMVRTIVGTLLEIGQGKRPPGDLPRVLAERDRRAAGPAAPAHGLVLERISYREENEPAVMAAGNEAELEGSE
jgi:tRNA pseudouridine38-40 synthase